MSVHETPEIVAKRLKRLRCVLFGCVAADEYPGCSRCGEALYGGDFIEDYARKLEWLFHARWRVRQFFRRFARQKCEECGKKFWRGYPANDRLCSEECFDAWIPF